MIEARYEWASAFSEGLAAVSEGGKWGFVDRSGAAVVECQYDRVEDFLDGLARVNIGGHFGGCVELGGGKWYYIDKTGRTVWSPD